MPAPWQDKISNPAQLGGIETSVLDNGAGRGVRIAWINTGSGLRYKLVLDRAMDIAEAFYNEHSLTWISHTGITCPQPLSDKGTDWIRSFGGGLLVTCGLDHAGGPEQDSFGTRGLHGRISHCPARIESVVQPDIRSGRLSMSITGIINQTQPLGARYELKRTISGELGRAGISIHDEVTNTGNTAIPHMLLYHINLGWPLVDAGSRLLWNGGWTPRETGEANKIFRPGNDFHVCPEPLDGHRGGGEEVAFINAAAGATGHCFCGVYNSKLNLALQLKFQKKQLPWLTNWLHFGKGEYVTGLEPGTNQPIGQSALRDSQQLIVMEPGETRMYDVEITVFTSVEDIRQFRSLFPDRPSNKISQ